MQMIKSRQFLALQRVVDYFMLINMRRSLLNNVYTIKSFTANSDTNTDKPIIE